MNYLRIANKIAVMLAYIYKYCIAMGVNKDAYIRLILRVILGNYYHSHILIPTKSVVGEDSAGFVLNVIIKRSIGPFLVHHNGYLQMLLDGMTESIKILDNKAQVLFNFA